MLSALYSVRIDRDIPQSTEVPVTQVATATTFVDAGIFEQSDVIAFSKAGGLGMVLVAQINDSRGIGLVDNWQRAAEVSARTTHKGWQQVPNTLTDGVLDSWWSANGDLFQPFWKQEQIVEMFDIHRELRYTYDCGLHTPSDVSGSSPMHHTVNVVDELDELLQGHWTDIFKSDIELRPVLRAVGVSRNSIQRTPDLGSAITATSMGGSTNMEYAQAYQQVNTPYSGFSSVSQNLGVINIIPLKRLRDVAHTGQNFCCGGFIELHMAVNPGLAKHNSQIKVTVYNLEGPEWVILGA